MAMLTVRFNISCSEWWQDDSIEQDTVYRVALLMDIFLAFSFAPRDA